MKCIKKEEKTEVFFQAIRKDIRGETIQNFETSDVTVREDERSHRRTEVPRKRGSDTCNGS